MADIPLTFQVLIGIPALPVLVFGAEKVVEKMERIAAYYSIPDVLIAMSVVSIGTSLPEFVLHVVGSFKILSNPGCIQQFYVPGAATCKIISATVLGGNIGSDVVQQTLVLGLVVFSFSFFGDKNHFQFSESFLKKDYFPMMGTTLMTLVLAWDGILSRVDGAVLVGSFIAYMYYLYRTRDRRLNQDVEPSDNIRKDILIGTGGILAVVVSAHIILEATETVVQATGLGGSLIGVMTVGLVSAFPELFTAIQGIRKKAAGISLGTLIGSNITNPLLAIGLGSLLSTYWVPRPLVLWDLPMETVTAGLLLTYLLFVSDRKLGYKGAIYLILLYFFYAVIRGVYFSKDALV
ncbi:MAG: sodium:calcium antiporter [Candidatus Nanohaloarchaea archaeon]